MGNKTKGIGKRLSKEELLEIREGRVNWGLVVGKGISGAIIGCAFGSVIGGVALCLILGGSELWDEL